MRTNPEPSEDNHYLASHVRLLAESYQRLTGRVLIESPSPSTAPIARFLYEAPFVVMSHGLEHDPIFNYANLAAQRLFEMPWSRYTQTPSRMSAEPVNREERARLLDTVSRQGFIDNYRGVRISNGGQRFFIERATVWNVIDEKGEHHGQAATFESWTPLPST